LRRYILLGLMLAVIIGPALAQEEDFGDVEAFRQALEQDDFIVQEGELGFFDFIQLYEAGVLPSAYGNNPATRYLIYFVPPAPGYAVDERIAAIAQALGKSGNSSTFWNLGPDEAVVFVGRTPPECRYFSYTHYLMSRTFDNEPRWIFANIADTLNNLVINTGGAPGEPFNQTTMIVSTADRGIDERIRAAALSAGYSEDIMNTQVFPSSILRMGLENDSDTFAVYFRPALFTDTQAGDEYLNNTPATIFRVTPTNATELDPYDYPELRVRGTGQTEFDLTDDLNELESAILERYSNLSATELPTALGVPVGSDAIQRGIDGIGPNNDAVYLWTANQTANSPTPPFFDTTQYYDFLREPPLTLGNDTDEFIIVYGVNHAATGKATYTNFVLNGADIFNGVGSITDADFNGTAGEYLPNNPNAQYLYAYKVARDCEGDQYCFEVPSGVGGYGIELDQPIFIAWRLYLEEATQTGPSYAEIVYDRAIKFDPAE
jgi:hypothetical protein